MAKRIEKQSTVAIPQEPTTEITTNNQVVVAHLKFENLSGIHNLRWELYFPW